MNGGPFAGSLGRVLATLATILSIGLLYLIGHTALASASPLAATQLPPVQNPPLLRLRLNELLVPGQRVPRDMARLARETALSEPLAFEPFFVQAYVAEQSGRMDDAIALMEEARLRRRSFAP